MSDQESNKTPSKQEAITTLGKLCDSVQGTRGQLQQLTEMEDCIVEAIMRSRGIFGVSTAPGYPEEPGEEDKSGE